MAGNTIFVALGIQDKHYEKTALIRSTLPPGSYKAPLDLLPRSLSLHCKQINKVTNKLDGQPSSLLASMHVSNYKETFSPIHLVFLDLDTDRPHLDFKILDEKKKTIELAQKYIILLSEVSIVNYKAGKHNGAEKDKFIHFNFSAGTYSIDDFDAKIKVAILKQRQDCEPPQIKDLRLVIAEDFTFMASNTIFIALVYKTTILKRLR